MKMVIHAVVVMLIYTVTVGQANAREFDAVLHWSKRLVLTTLSDGVVQTILVNVGDRVKQGELMLQLDPAVFDKRVKQSAVHLQSASEAFKEATRELERAQELYDRTVLSDHDLQVAKNNHIKARSDLENARLQHTQAKYDFKYSRIIAPFNALVLERHVQPGQVIKSELQPLPMLTVADADRMRARILIDEEALSSVSMKQSANISVGSDTFKGEIVSIGFEPVNNKSGSRSYPVEIEFAVGDRLLRAGQSARVDL